MESVSSLLISIFIFFDTRYPVSPIRPDNSSDCRGPAKDPPTNPRICAPHPWKFPYTDWVSHWLCQGVWPQEGGRYPSLTRNRTSLTRRRENLYKGEVDMAKGRVQTKRKAEEIMWHEAGTELLFL
jgi:hypothetical protein